MTTTHTVVAKDLTREPPRSPHAQVGGYVLLGRIIDKCRASLAGTAGEYVYDAPMDRYFFDFARIDADALRDFVATGADDEAVGKWVRERSERNDTEVKLWNIQLKEKRISELPPHVQGYMHDYIERHIPAHRRVRTVFDIYDLEEGHI
jgi:hypothetical protein